MAAWCCGKSRALGSDTPGLNPFISDALDKEFSLSFRSLLWQRMTCEWLYIHLTESGVLGEGEPS